MKFPCPTRPISCPGQGNLDYDGPFANLSSERPDHPIYVGVGWGPFDPPPLGGFWEATGCLFVCESIISQEDADLCAAEQADFCTWGGWGPPGGGPVGPPGGGGGSPIRTFANRQQQCSAGCPDGSVFTWTILANTYFATSQAQADLIASSEACAKAAHFFFCLSSLDGNAQVGVLYSLPVFVTGANLGPFTFAMVDGSLPPGIIISPGGNSSVIVNGNPTTAGTYTFTIQANDPGGNFIRKTYAITVTGTVCDATIDWINNPGNCRLRIKAYADGQLQSNLGCPAFLAGAGTVWDGTFTLFNQIVPNTTCNYKLPNTFGQVSGLSLNNASTILQFNAGTWTLSVIGFRAGPASQTLWSGTLAGNSPLGIYTVGFGTCSNPPATLTVEGYTP